MEINENKLLILDGAMGTMLQRRGLKMGEIPEMINITHPDWIEDIHRAFIDAGSQVIYANTFGANRLKMAGTGYTVEETVRAAIRNARRAADGTDTLVAVDIGPIGELLEPMGTLRFEEAIDVFAEIAKAGAEAGADLCVIETMTDLYEAKAALLAVKENTSLPVFVTMTFDETGRTFTGCTAASMAHTLEGLGADAIGVNCSLGPKQLMPVIREVCAATRLPVIAKPNAGLPDPVDGHYDLSPEAFAQTMREAVEAGVSIVGGCCGTNPDYIRCLTEALRDVQPGHRRYEPASFVCTPSVPLKVEKVTVIGERINPTGKKRLQQALLQDDLDYLVNLAIQQVDAGAAILDVNVGFPGVDEATMLPRVVKRLQAVVDAPLQLDSSNPAALEAGLRVYNGKAAVNSVSGTEESMARVLPIVKKYGAAVVGLTLDEGGIPQTALERVAIARRIVERAAALGIPREDVWIDCLTLTVSAQQSQAEETLNAVRMVTEEMCLRTVLGVSNISFGLPNRLLMTQTFLIRAIQCGLTLPIINPNQVEIMDAIAACRVLSGEDEECRGYIARLANRPKAAESSNAAAAPAIQPSQTAGSVILDEAIIRGLRVEAGKLAKAALREETELQLVENHLIPALDRVGEAYEKGSVFLPQLLGAAQAAQSVFEAIRDSLAQKGGAPVKKGSLVIATVKGDIHDIGKNIVRTVLENYGYDVIDLGRDVPPEAIVSIVRKREIRLVGLSALMTTTLPSMEETIRQLRALPQPPVIFVGGAVLTEEYAARMGADYYTKDARASVEVARRVLG